MTDLDTIFTTLDTIQTWPANWNGYDALPPDPQSIAHAREWITDLYAAVQEKQLQWLEPNVTASADGEVVFEWWRKSTAIGNVPSEHKLTVYVGPKEYVDTLRITIDGKTEGYSDARLSKIDDCRRIWEWLLR